jgi:hypothetical protein
MDAAETFFKVAYAADAEKVMDLDMSDEPAATRTALVWINGITALTDEDRARLNSIAQLLPVSRLN